MALDLLKRTRMTLPVRSYRSPSISVVDPARDSNSQMEATVRRPVPPFLLQLTRDSGVDVNAINSERERK